MRESPDHLPKLRRGARILAKTMMQIEQLEIALRSTNPTEAVRPLVVKMSSEGQSKASIYESLEQFLVELRGRANYSEGDEELVLGVMDALTGWCHPDARLLPD